MTNDPASIEVREAALTWVIRVQDPGFSDWDGLTVWLDADPYHSEWFDRLTVRDAQAADWLRDTTPEPKPGPSAFVHAVESGSRQPAAWMRLAAGLAIPLLLTGGWLLHVHLVTRSASTTTVFATRPGEQRQMALADGSRIAMAGATRMSIDGAKRHATLLTGRATFFVIHDPVHPFSVDMGPLRVTDVGTVFDLHRLDNAAEIAVASGTVDVEDAHARYRLHVGERMTMSGGAATLKTVTPSAVGGWRSGRFDYADATVAEVAVDLRAATGLEIRVSPEVEGKPFAGSIRLGADPGRALRSIAPLLGVSVRQVGSIWELYGSANAIEH